MRKPLDLSRPDDARLYLSDLEMRGELLFERAEMIVETISDETAVIVAQAIFLKAHAIPADGGRQ